MAVLLGVVVLTPPCLCAATNDLSGLLQKGLFEEANRNLDAAVQAYQALVTTFDQDRRLAATAVFRLGECYRKLGKTNEAVLQYDRIVREFADEATLATLSRQNLAGLGAPANKAASNPAFTDRLQSIIAKAAVPTLDDEETEIRRLQAMLQNSPDLINDASAGMTPLCQAASKGQLRVAAFLLDHGAAIDRKAGNQTPLHYAVSSGNKAMVELLLQRGADVNAKDGTGGTALHEAAQDGFLSVAEVLVQHKADLNSLNSQQNGEKTPLHVAVAKGHRAMAEYLIARGAELDAMTTSGWTPLFDAAFRGHAELLATLLAAGAKRDVMDKEGRTALSIAAELGDLDSAKVLLAAKADPNAGKVNLPIHAAIHGKSPKVLETVLKSGADANRSALVKYEIRTRTGIFPQGATVSPLFLALTERNADAAALLLRCESDPNGKSPDGMPLVAYACISNQPDMLKLLLDAGASPDAPCDSDGSTALHLAVGSRNAPLVRMLLVRKADPNLRNKGNQTTLDVVNRLENLLRLTQLPQPVTPWTVATPASPAELEDLLRQNGAKEGSPSPEAAKPPEKP